MTWIYSEPPPIPNDLLAWVGHDLLAKLLVQRGISTVAAARAFIDPDQYRPAYPADLPDLDLAVDLIDQALEQGWPIWVWGDFDVDGQTATALLVSILESLEAEVRYYVPNRLTEGHGLHLAKLEAILTEGARLILTCDTGIEAHQAVALIHQFEAQVIITDHHDLGEKLPPAEAVVNPKRLPADHPLRELPGVGVAYILAQALAQHRGQADLAEPLLDLVALGIVADVALQRDDTRYLLQRGLAVLRDSDRTGLKALVAMTNLPQDRLTAEHIAFYLGPRLNALGRLGDANQGVELLTTTNRTRARILAAQLDALSDRSRMLVDRTVVQALGQVADNPALADYNALVLSAQDWHPGVIGIACSRLVEEYHRPVILLTSRHGDLRGSARSIPGCDIHQAIRSQAHYLTQFGGHPMAAGLRLPSENLTAFRQGLSEALAPCVSGEPTPLAIDAVLTLPQLNLDLLKTLDRLAPFGAGNPAITLAVKNLRVQKAAIFGRTRLHRRVDVCDLAGHEVSLIWWNGAAEPLPEGLFDLALTLSRDDYRQTEAVQLVWVDYYQEEALRTKPDWKIIDLRDQSDSEAALQDLLQDPDLVFWAVEELPRVATLPPEPASTMPVRKLVLWQAPPGQTILQEVLYELRPEEIYLVIKPSPYDQPNSFMTRLIGLVKYSLTHYEGQINLIALAHVMGHHPSTIRLGLEILINRGMLDLITETEEILLVHPPQHKATSDKKMIGGLLNELNHSLREAVSYRQFAKTASLAGLGLTPRN